jgi:hypothetical protein
MKVKDYDGLSENYSPLPGVYVNGRDGRHTVPKSSINENNAIIAFIKVNGEINVSINGLK